MAEPMDGVTDADTPMTNPDDQVVADIQANFELIRNAVSQFDHRLTLRALRSISLVRKKLNQAILVSALQVTEAGGKAAFMYTTDPIHSAITTIFKGAGIPLGPRFAREIPEVEVYLGILIQVYFYDTKQFELGAQYSCDLADRIHQLDRRGMDPLASKVYFYLSLFHEELDPKPPSAQAQIIAIRPRLLAAYQTATLRNDTETQAAVIVLLLRNYVLTAHIVQADAFLSCISFPESVSNNLYARYMYYLGRIRAVQLSYSQAHANLVDATRKAPSSATAVGFYQSAMKYLIIVELLMGDIPDRSYFSQPKLEKSLRPYFGLVNAVRAGNTEWFKKTLEENSDTFHADGTSTLVYRLRQNVIRTGIRGLSLAYSRIELGDICQRLVLRSENSTEYIVSKAIGDGVIDATINREAAYMETKRPGDIYATTEPTRAFNQRIRTCLKLHDESVKAMRFPMNKHRLELKNAQEARDRERELVKEIQDGDIDDDDGAGDFDAL